MSVLEASIQSASTADILTDRFGRLHQYLRISLTDRCNLRCFYCMPHEGMSFSDRDDLLSANEIIRVATTFVNLGVNKIRLTGGEPLVREDVFEIIQRLKVLNNLKMLALTTNGLLLKGNANSLKQAGIDVLNISLDTLDSKRFQDITKRDSFNTVMAGLEEALNTGFNALKVNVVVMKGINDDEVLNFVEFAKDKPLNVRFIETMPFQGNLWEPKSIVPYRDIMTEIEKYYSLTPVTTESSAVAKDFKLKSLQGKNYQGTISFITSMTDSFCRSCNRIRITADGNIKSCLFSDNEVSFRDDLRAGMTETELQEKIRQSILQKQKEHEPVETLATISNRPMISIGG